MNKIKRITSLFILFLLIFSGFIVFTSCQSTDKTNSYLDTSRLGNTQYEYDKTKNQTKITWFTTLTNDTIYRINNFDVQFKLYKDSNLVKTDKYNYTVSVKNGADYTGSFYFYADGEIDNIKYESWTAHYDSFWETYKIWLIVTSAIAGVAAIIYIVVMIIQDLELDDVGDFLSEHWWLFFAFIAPLAGTVWGIVTSYWVPALIVVGGIVAFVLIMLIAHLIKYIVQNIAYSVSFGWGGGYSKGYANKADTEDYFDIYSEDVEDYVTDEDKLRLFNMEQLKDYCRSNQLRGYSSLNKDSLIDFIVKSSVKEEQAESNKKEISKPNNSRITFNDIAGLEEAKNAFREKVVYAFEHKDLYEKYGKKVGGGILLYGLPGTGKTMFAEAASNETDSLFIPIKCSDIKSKWYGESESNVKKIFEKARKAKKAIIFFDEFEAIGAKRTDDGDNGNNDLVPQILAEMQGIGSNKSSSVITVIAATNKPWAIDSAFLRPGRFDEKIYIPLPDFQARKKLFELKLKSVPQEDLNYDYLANISEGFNGADIGAFCDKLKMRAINKSIENNAECPITVDDVEWVKGIIKSSVVIDDIEQLRKFNNSFR